MFLMCAANMVAALIYFPETVCHAVRRECEESR